MFVDRFLQPFPSDLDGPVGARYDERRDVTVTATGATLVEAIRQADDPRGRVRADGGRIPIGKTTKASRDKPAARGLRRAKETRADRDRPRERVPNSGKKTGGDKDKPVRNRLLRGMRPARSLQGPGSRPTRPGDERVTAVRSDKPRLRQRPRRAPSV